MKPLIRSFFLALMLLPLLAHAIDDDELLLPEQAFKVAGSATQDEIKLDWRIVEGYYLYKSKFSFSADDGGVELGTPVLPDGKVKQDDFFGEMEIYRHSAAITIPYTAPATVDTIKLKVRSQGCADIGICYPPQTTTLTLERPAEGVSVDPLAALQSLGSDLMGSLGGGDEEEFLPAEQAFQFSADVIDGHTLHLKWDVAEGYYLYRDKFEVIVTDGNPVKLGAPEYAKSETKDDPLFGKVEVYHVTAEMRVPIADAAGQSEVPLLVKYQGCADRGICYPPMKTNITLPISTAADGVSAAPTAAVSNNSDEPKAEQDQIADLIAGESSWYIVGVFFLIGLGLAFTPCVFPMIPILSGIITGQGSNITARKGFLLSLVYVLAMAVTYTIAGVVAASFGENLQAALQNPVVLSVFALIFVALAFSMFGFYELQLPSALQSRLTEVSNQQKSGSLVGAGVMGLLSALIVGPCVAPPLAGALIYIGQTGDTVLGGMALFAMAMGMGAPLIVIGTSAGKLLPRAGAWMDAVKAVFGVIMLAIAVFLLERVVSPGTSMLLWGTLLIVSAVYMGAISALPEGVSGWRRLWKGLGVVLLVYGVLFLIGVAAGGKNTVQPLRGVLVGSGGAAGGAVQAHLEFERIKTVDDLNARLAAAQAAGKPVMLDFYADWCIYCVQMERDTFPDPAVQAALADFVLLQADVTANDAADKALQKHIGIPAPPAMIFWGPDGKERRHLRLLGFMGADEFAPHVMQAR